MNYPYLMVFAVNLTDALLPDGKTTGVVVVEEKILPISLLLIRCMD